MSITKDSQNKLAHNISCRYFFCILLWLTCTGVAIATEATSTNTALAWQVLENRSVKLGDVSSPQFATALAALNTDRIFTDGFERIERRTWSGTISEDTVWTKGDGTAYIIDGNLTVASGVTLTIQPGVRVEVSGYYRLTIDGTLIAQGTNADPVTFTSGRTSPAARDWRGISISSNTAVVVLDQVLLEYADRAIEITGASDVEISNSEIRNNRYGIYVQGNNSAVDNPQPVITGNAIYANSRFNYYAISFGDPANVTLNATGNWWGSSDPVIVGQRIFDRFDYASSPWVDYTGYLDGLGGEAVSGNQSIFGLISTDISYPAGVYDVLGGITVAQGVTLTLEAGVVLRFMGNYSLTVDGSLIAQGTGVDPVIFTSGRANPVAGTWQGIKISGTAVVVLGQVLLEYANRAVEITGTSDVEISNSEIRNNRYGIYVQGNNSAVDNPQPVITGNAIYANSRFNYYAISFGDPANVTLNATGNWWGSSDPLIVGQRIFDRSDNASSPWVNYIGFLDGAGGQDTAKFLIFNTQITDFQISPHLNPNEETTLTFSTNTPVSSTLEVYQIDGTTLLYTDSQNHSVAGIYEYKWNGRDQSGTILPNDTYKLVLTASDGNNQFSWDPAASGIGSVSGSVPAAYNIFQNEYWKININMARPGLVSMRVTPNGETAFYPVDSVPYAAGTHLLTWDGRAPNGDVVTGAVSIYFPAPINIKANTVIIRVGKPNITGTGTAPNIEVKSDPYYITHSYDQFTNITYRIDQDSNVTFKLLPPGISDPDDPAAIVLLANQAQSAVDTQGDPLDHNIEWRGYDLADTNNIQVSEEGAYTFTIEATSVASGQTTLYRGIIQIGR